MGLKVAKFVANFYWVAETGAIMAKILDKRCQFTVYLWKWVFQIATFYKHMIVALFDT